MYKLNFNIKQHTPLIHFQPDQQGATLRASEVKPKLDRYILEILGGIPKIRTDHPDWFVSNEHEALDYKIGITSSGPGCFKSYIENPKRKDENGEFKGKINKDGDKVTETHPYPLFFGNMGLDYNRDEIKKLIIYNDPIHIQIKTFSASLKNAINNHLGDFFNSYNFGSRQGKGFGSFSKIENDEYQINDKLFDYKFSFEIKTINTKYFEFFKEVFTNINWFYCSLRGGLNTKSPQKDVEGEMIRDNENQIVMKDDFYFKSLLFLYFAKQPIAIQWEKKTIKESFFPHTKRKFNNSLVYAGLDDQQSLRIKIDYSPLYFSSKEKLLVRDLLGLSSEEQWQSYRDTITKTEAKKDSLGAWGSKDKNDPTLIQRYSSPLFFI
jgi:hypothetical protein